MKDVGDGGDDGASIGEDKTVRNATVGVVGLARKREEEVVAVGMLS